MEQPILKSFGKGNQEFYMNGNFDRITSNYEDLKSILPRILGNNLPSVLAKLGNVNIAGAIELTQKIHQYRCVNVISIRIFRREFSHAKHQ